MNKPKKTKKKVVVVTGKKGEKQRLKPTQSKKTKTARTTKPGSLIFGRENFKWVLIGIGFIALGMILMMGGSMPSPDVWDESLIYSHRRITLAPIVILIGLGIEVYAIFK